MNSDISKKRKKIDSIDKKIIDLLKKRKDYVKEIQKIKKLKKIPPKDPKREKQIFRRAGKFKNVFKEILR